MNVKQEKSEPSGSNGNGDYQNLLPKKVGIVYSDVRREYFPTEEQYITEKDAERDAGIIANEIKKLNIQADLYPGNDSLVENLKKSRPDMVFNLVDSVKGNEYLSSTIPGLLDMLDIPYTGAGLLGLALCYNKFLTKKLLKNAGIPVPNFQLFNSASDNLDTEMRFPLISKLNEIHGSVEINKNAVSENEKELKERIKFLLDTYKQPVLVEEFIVGREINIMVLEGLNTKVYMAEKVFNKTEDKYSLVTFEDQWEEVLSREDWHFDYTKYDEPTLKEYGRKAFETTRMADYGKFDVRLDESGRYYFIDSNANPAFGPRELETAIGIIVEELHNIPFTEILKRLMINTIKANTQ